MSGLRRITDGTKGRGVVSALVACVVPLAAAAGAILTGREAGGWAALALGTAFAWVALRQSLRLGALADGLARIVPGDSRGDPAEDLSRVAELVSGFEHRRVQRHPVSNLPTREPLFVRIEAERAGGGVLGVLAFPDHERLAAFDPALADRVLATLIGRVRDMTGDGPLIAHVDRARLALWYGPAIASDSARAELNALAYALGGMIRDGEHELLPAVRLGLVQAGEDGAGASALLTRAVAALPGGTVAAAVSEDPIEAARRDYALEQGLRQAIARDEFELHFQPLVDADAARAELNALAYALGGMIRDGEHELLPAVRLGLVQAGEDGVGASALLTRAVAALPGGTVAAAVSEDPIEAARRDYALEQGLRQAIARDEFELHFQPLVDADAARVVGAEALLRWRHSTLGPVSPARFIPIAEAAGLADEVGLWVLNAACREARGWQRLGLDATRVAVNVSGHQLRRPDMRALVERTLGRHGLSADRLEIELTETVATGDIDSAAALFESLRDLGVSIAIDDFGTGFSSLSSLRRLSFDKLKIDREFVTDVATRRDSQAICQAMLALGRGLGIRVLAEGVEHVADYDWLRRQGCNHFQGYHFSPPLGASEFVSFVRDTRRIAVLAAGTGADSMERRRA